MEWGLLGYFFICLHFLVRCRVGWNLFPLILRSLWCVPQAGYITALRSYSALGILLLLIIIMMHGYSHALSTQTACLVYHVGSVPKMELVLWLPFCNILLHVFNWPIGVHVIERINVYKSLPLAIYLQEGMGVRTLHISYAQCLWHISNIITILTTKLYTVMGYLEIYFSLFIKQSLNCGCFVCFDLELLPKIGKELVGLWGHTGHYMRHYLWFNPVALLSE